MIASAGALLAATCVHAQAVAPASAAEPSTRPLPNLPAAQARTGASGEEEVVTLSPFEVVSDTRGYFAANTMSGTRFNSKIEDLAASLSVMTKEQMSDFAMLDVNDVFMYMGGVEGTGTYTDYEIDRNGQLTDNVQMNPTMANRVRGISSANISYGNYESMGRTPIDPLVIEGVEVSRGPNANVFGLGNSSGTVNQVPVSANLTRNRTKVEFRTDSYGGYRSSFDTNRVVIPGLFALRASASFNHEDFIREPAGVNTVRYNVFAKFQPTPSTRLSAGFLHYRMNGNRPNYTPPRDYVSAWVEAGKPGWDPIAQVVHLNGQTIGNGGPGTTTPITSDNNLPYYLYRAGTMQTRSNIYVDQGGIAYWTTPSTNNPASNPFTPAANTQSVRLMQSGINLGSPTASPGRYTNQPLFTTTPSVSSKDIYDWSDINLSSVNRLMDRSDTFMAEVDQRVFQTQRQMLAFQLGFFREDSTRYQRTPIGNSGTSGQSGQLFIDINEKNLDGTPNPFFGRPYIAATEPLTRLLPSKWDTYRAQAAYRIDLRGEKSALKWLGLQQISAYNEYKYRITRSYSFRDVLSSNHSWTQTGLTGFAANQARGNQSNVTNGPQSGANIVRGYFRYYVGDNQGANIDYAPSSYSYGNYPFVWGGYTLSGGVPVAGSGRFTNENATLSEVATTDSTGGNNNLKQILKTRGAVLQSYFLNNDLITTFGIREDKVYSKNGVLTTNLVENNTVHDYDTTDRWQAGDYRYNVGKTKTAGAVLHPFRSIRGIGSAASQGSGIGKYLAQIAKGLAVTYNKADNFIPQAPAVDLFLNQLPNITGSGKDYGFWLNLAEGKYVIRVNKWSTKQLNARNGEANTVAQRVLRLDLDISSDAYQLYDRADAWTRLRNPGWTDAQVRQAVADQMKLPTELYNKLYDNFRAGTIAATNDIEAKGMEVELNFNPTRHWTITGSVNKTESTSTNISEAVQKWIDLRMPVWTSIVDPNDDPNLGTGQSQGWATTADNPKRLWWIHNYGGSQTASQNYATFVDAPYRVIKQQEGKSKPNVRKYGFKFSSSYQLSGITDHAILKNFRVGGSVRWEDRGSIGYYGLQTLPTPITELDPNRPIWDKAHWYFDAFVSYRTRLTSHRIPTSVQLNVRNIQESGRLQAIGAFPDGTPNAYRIVDPRQFILSVSFEL